LQDEPTTGQSETFNALAAPERMKMFQDAMNKFITPELMAEAQNSWKALTSSVEDFRKFFVRKMGAPLFEKFKGGLKSLVAFFVENKETIGKVATFIGKAIVFPFEVAQPVIAFFGKRFSELNELFAQNPKVSALVIKGVTTLFKGLGLLVGVTLAVGAAFVGIGALGITTIFTGIGWAVGKVVQGATDLYTAWQEAGGGIGGVLTVLGNALEGLKIIAFNVFDNILLSFVNLGLGLLQAAKDTPLLGKAIGFADSSLNIQSGLESRAAQLQSNIESRGGTVWGGASTSNSMGDLNVTNIISTSDPVAAGEAAARNTGKVFAKNFPGSGKLGNTIVDMAY
jgi:hypothetical protein